MNEITLDRLAAGPASYPDDWEPQSWADVDAMLAQSRTAPPPKQNGRAEARTPLDEEDEDEFNDRVFRDREEKEKLAKLKLKSHPQPAGLAQRSKRRVLWESLEQEGIII